MPAETHRDPSTVDTSYAIGSEWTFAASSIEVRYGPFATGSKTPSDRFDTRWPLLKLRALMTPNSLYHSLMA